MIINTIKNLVDIKYYRLWGVGFWVMVFNATFNNISVISWRSDLLVEETIVPRG